MTERLSPATATTPYHADRPAPPAPPRTGRGGTLVRHLASAILGAAVLATVLLLAVERPGTDDGAPAPDAEATAVATPSERQPDSPPATASMATIEPRSLPLRLEPDEIEIEAGKRKKVEVLDNDESSDDDAEIDEDTLTVVRPPEHARSWRVDDDEIQVRTDRRYIGTDSLVYQVCDTTGRCGTAELQIITTRD